MSTPATNTPGRPEIFRRVGTTGDFAERMADELSRQEALDTFTNRRADDPAIALVDAWAAVLDVLTFYSDRVANEGYLRTATDPRSLTELAHAVGYTPGRGRASATELAFTLEDAPGSPAAVPIPAGTKVSSLPAPGEVPQNYETTAELLARPAWNAMRARTRVPVVPQAGAVGAYVEGVRTDLTVGDGVLVVGSDREDHSASPAWCFRILTTIRPLPAIEATWIGWREPLGTPATGTGREGAEQVPEPLDLRLHLLRRKAAIFGAAAPDFRLISESAGGGKADPRPASGAGLVLHESDKTRQHRAETTRGTGPDWPGFSVRTEGQPENTVDLDATYPEAAAGTWAVLVRPGVTACYRILSSSEEARTDFTLNAKVSRLRLSGPTVSHLFGSHVRPTSAYVGSEVLPLAAAPVPTPVQGIEVDLAREVPTLEAGRTVIVRGPRPFVRVREGVRHLQLRAPRRLGEELHAGDVLEVTGPVTHNLNGTVTWDTTRGTVTAPAGALERIDPPEDADVRSETAVVAGPTPNRDEVDLLRFDTALTGCYDRESVRILANVAPATHGETKAEILGSGDAARSFQRFQLAQAPLTYVPARSGGTVVSSLQVRVDGRLWKEVPRLFGCRPTDEVFTTLQDDEGEVTVLFGDGLTGARLPTGVNNVAATYRVGTGISGRLAADQLTLPMTRPLGLRSVTNPLPTGLAADPEPASDIRANTPRTALALERVVSLRDVEEFARAVPGIGKARATWLWDGRHRFVHLTVAGSGGQRVDAQAITDLRAALLAAGDRRLPLQVDEAQLVPVDVSVSVVVDPGFEPRAVLDEVTRSITAALSTDGRALGQPLTNGDIIIPSHAVAGVVAVHVTLPRSDVPSTAAHLAGGVARPAQLVVLRQGGLAVTEASS